MNTFLNHLACAGALCVPMLAASQTTPPDRVERSKPAPWRYESAFADYKPWKEITLSDWRAINDAVKPSGRHTGHGAHAARDPGPAPDAAKGPAAPEAGHDPHQMHRSKP